MKKFIAIASIIVGLSGLINANSIAGNWHLDRIDAKTNSALEGAFIGFIKKVFSDIKFNDDGSCRIGQYLKKCYRHQGAKYILYDGDGKSNAKGILQGKNRLKVISYNKKGNINMYFHRIGKSALKTPKKALRFNRVYHASKNGENMYLLFKTNGDYYILEADKDSHVSIADFKTYLTLML